MNKYLELLPLAYCKNEQNIIILNLFVMTNPIVPCVKHIFFSLIKQRVNQIKKNHYQMFYFFIIIVLLFGRANFQTNKVNKYCPISIYIRAL